MRSRAFRLSALTLSARAVSRAQLFQCRQFDGVSTFVGPTLDGDPFGSNRYTECADLRAVAAEQAEGR